MTSARPAKRLRPAVWMLTAAFVFSVLASATAEAQSRRSPRNSRTRGAKEQAAPGPQDFRSKNFLVHTDLPEEEAEALLKRLETMLSIISRYWGQPNRKTIECYVVKDLANWPDGFFPANAMSSLQGNAGVTLSEKLVNARTGRPLASQAIAYAVADDGTPQHEAVHAYCYLNFGEVGPTWYSEGMAEMGNYWREDDSSVELPEVVLQYLQESNAKPLSGIVNNTDQTGDSWQNYAWRWALCHMLANNTNYAPRFRPLGLNLLTGKNDSFEQTYGNMAREIEFEYRFFLEHLDNGLRADLISWDWKSKFQTVSGARSAVCDVEAKRGWQPSRLRTETGKAYQVSADGEWQIEADGSELTADGGDDGRGRLVGAIFDPESNTLGEPFDLGADVMFTAAADGNLYLRCNDGWGALGDNDGEMEVKIKRAP